MREKYFKIFITIFFCISVIFAGIFYYSYKQINTVRNFGRISKFIIEHNESYEEVYDKLVKRKFASKKIFARIAMRYLKERGQNIVPGEYRIEKSCSLLDIMKKICSGDVIIHNIIIWRGQCTHDIKQIFHDRNDLIGELDEDFKDGELFAGKYEFTYPMTKNTMIKLIRQKSQKNLEKLWKKRSEKCIVKTPQECVSLASIIAREAMLIKDIKLVTSVFANRLKKGMKLQSDPTVIYPLTNGTFKGKTKLTYKDIDFDSPYNTYKYAGIPPAPISSPSEEDIKAVLDPVESEYLYFISKLGNPELFFSKTYKEHCELKNN